MALMVREASPVVTPVVLVLVASRVRSATRPVTVLVPAPSRVMVSPTCAVPFATVMAVEEVTV